MPTVSEPFIPATTEQRERAAAYWETVARPQMDVRQPPASRENPHNALARLKAEGWNLEDIAIGHELLSKLAELHRASAAG